MGKQNSNEITLLGYSERGVMNALFYGIAYHGSEKDLQKFLNLAVGEDAGSYSDFEIIMEGSLSDFGDSDAIIIAKRNNNEKTVFFIEAKVSNGSNYSLKKYLDEFSSGIKNETSNLFYQLSLKYYLFTIREKVFDKEKNEEEYTKFVDNVKLCNDIKRDNYIKRVDKGNINKKSRTYTRRWIGENKVVHKIAEKIKGCNHAKYIAITPDNTDISENIKDIDILKNFKDDLHFITWSDINEKFGLSKVIEFNSIKTKTGKNKSLILNTSSLK